MLKECNPVKLMFQNFWSDQDVFELRKSEVLYVKHDANSVWNLKM